MTKVISEKQDFFINLLQQCTEGKPNKSISSGLGAFAARELDQLETQLLKALPKNFTLQGLAINAVKKNPPTARYTDNDPAIDRLEISKPLKDKLNEKKLL